MREKCLENLLQSQQTRLPFVQCYHVDAENTLHRRLFEQVVQHDITDLTPAQLDYDAHAVLI